MIAINYYYIPLSPTTLGVCVSFLPSVWVVTYKYHFKKRIGLVKMFLYARKRNDLVYFLNFTDCKK